jgi:hypothetical protein
MDEGESRLQSEVRGDPREREHTAAASAAPAPGKTSRTSAGVDAHDLDGGDASAPAPPRAATSVSVTGGALESRLVSILAGVEPDLVGGDATTASTATTSAATWRDHGQFKWWIRWATDGTSGWLVQRVTNTYSGTKRDGTAITNATVGAHPSYYECWPVTATGQVRVSASDARNVDQWERPSLGAGSKGSWSMRGEVYWTSTDPAGSGLTPGGASNAGILLSGFTAPAGLGSALLTRSADGNWDSTVTPATHTGSAS